MRLNLNETVKVKLTERGKELYRQYFSPLPDGFKQPEPRIDEDGFTQIQLWMFMEMFGEHMSMWQPNVIEPLEIVFDTEESDDYKELKSKLESDIISRQAAIDALTGWETDPTDEEIVHTLKALPPVEDMGEVSDGYHTFNQLYHQRAVLFATIVNQNKDNAWKSWKHEDGKFCFDKGGEWFIVGVDTPEGSYTYHYEKKYWDMFDCEELDRGKHWDGHTEDDVTRLLSLPPVEPPKKVVAQIKVDIDELMERIKEEYEIKDLPVCEDAISKHDLWRIIEDNAYWVTYNETSKEKGMTLTGINQALNECPPVEPERPKGEWVDNTEYKALLKRIESIENRSKQNREDIRILRANIQVMKGDKE